eukprot:TRINITY_DN26994_c0_g1_i1.p1 TRINITY_DN26994_c0_g1~~TRINITY_DN26994_c0_g1_i1.p1  ORF type:complete len:685 (-),score=138.07 TRINITY_DN26994_c0_g1_i1:75-2129(-)
MPARGKSSSRTRSRGHSFRRRTSPSSSHAGTACAANAPSAEALARELQAVAAELAEVKRSLRRGDTFLGMGGTLLQEYFVELTRKDNLLRLSLSQTASLPTGPVVRRAGNALLSRSRTSSLSEMSNDVGASVDRTVSPAASCGDSSNDIQCGDASSSTAEVSSRRRPSACDAHVGSACASVGELAKAESTPSLPEHVALAPAGSSQVVVGGSSASNSTGVVRSALARSTPEDYLVEVETANLATVLEFLEEHCDSPRAQRRGVLAIGRLARDEAQLRPLCVAAAAAAARAGRAFPAHRGLQRVAVAVLGSLAYNPQVAVLISEEVLPALFAAMTSHPEDEKLQALACEALARLAQAHGSGAPAVLKAIVQTLLGSQDQATLSVCTGALQRLLESGVCAQGPVLDVFLALSESQPERLCLQHRATMALQQLVGSGAVDQTFANKRAAHLMSTQWAQIIGRFSGAGDEEARNSDRFHAEVQTMFHEEVVKHFEFEAAERSLVLARRGVHGPACLREVITCFVENLEDYQSRLSARELAWDASRGCLAPLDADLRRKLCDEVCTSMEQGLIAALQAASLPLGSAPEESHKRRRSMHRSDCAMLLDRKTELTQAHHERAMELRREVMLFEAVEYLELHMTSASPTQVRSAHHMLDLAAGAVPSDAAERLRERLAKLAEALVEPPRRAG